MRNPLRLARRLLWCVQAQPLWCTPRCDTAVARPPSPAFAVPGNMLALRILPWVLGFLTLGAVVGTAIFSAHPLGAHIGAAPVAAAPAQSLPAPQIAEPAIARPQQPVASPTAAPKPTLVAADQAPALIYPT